MTPTQPRARRAAQPGCTNLRGTASRTPGSSSRPSSRRERQPVSPRIPHRSSSLQLRHDNDGTRSETGETHRALTRRFDGYRERVPPGGDVHQPGAVVRSQQPGFALHTGVMSMSTFPPIGDYAFLSNCEQSCLVAPDGSVEWMCLPRPDSPSVFGALLDRAAGAFRFGPANAQVPQNRRYVPGTMVLETTWQTPTGWMTVQDFLAVGPVEDATRRPDYHRAPTDTRPIGALMRIATCISGRVEVMVNCAPLFDYGAAAGTWSYQGEGYNAMTVAPKEGDVQLELAGSIRLGVLGARGYGRTTLTEGQSAYVVLSWGDANVPASQDEAFTALDTTVGFWRDWLATAKIPDHPWKPYLDRSALTLKALSYKPTGAIMAAATTSLPETPGGQRNWDYRFTWIRDSSFMLRALYRLGY